MPRRRARVTQADIARALRAAGQVGVRVRIDVRPDGTISLVPIGEDQLEPQTPNLATGPEIVL
jgi:hypothetical protein